MVTQDTFDRQPWISGGHFNDIDVQAAQLHGYGQQYQQLSRGRFEGRFRSFRLGDDLGIHFEMANRALAQSAWTPSGRYAACVLGEASPPCALNAGDFSQTDVVLCPEGKCIEGQTAAGMSICCIDIAYELLPDAGDSMRTTEVLRDARRSGQLRELVRSGLTAFSALDSLSSYPAAVKSFKSSLADLLWEMAAQSRSNGARRTSHHATARTLHIFRRAREYIHHGLADGIAVVELCAEVGVSRRSLEYVFQSVIGMGPSSYVRVLQLNHIRRDLLTEASREVSIGVIAARRGVWHWSRFSRHYRLLFGELPSQTRLRPRSDAGARREPTGMIVLGLTSTSTSRRETRFSQ
ncbi:MAG: transcriptional regulator, AraC family [Gammaproteobacteria bacterium]|nr:transcriptional regulator, AraC family [Gammaproteobacteria bacterium]